MKVVAARVRLNSRVYNSSEFYCRTFFDVKAGQEVIVDVPDYGLVIAMISDVNINASKLSRGILDRLIPIIQLVDKSAYYEYLAHENRLKFIKSEMDRRVKELKDKDIYEKLAKDDEILASMLIDYKEELSKYAERDSDTSDEL